MTPATHSIYGQSNNDDMYEARHGGIAVSELYFRTFSLIGLSTLRAGGGYPTMNVTPKDQTAKTYAATIVTVPVPLISFSDYSIHRLDLLGSHHV